MAKYADITPFYEWLEDLMRLDTSNHPDHNTLMFYEIMDELDSLPEMVRCKDRKYRKKKVCGNPTAGMWVGVELTENDYRFHGERRDNG